MAAWTLAGPAAAAFHAPSAFQQQRASVQMANIEDLPGATIEVGNKVFDPLGLSSLAVYGGKEFQWMRTAEVTAPHCAGLSQPPAPGPRIRHP